MKLKKDYCVKKYLQDSKTLIPCKLWNKIMISLLLEVVQEEGR